MAATVASNITQDSDAVVEASADLDAFADSIRREIKLADIHFSHTIEHALQAGRLLLEANMHVRHGQWQRWVEDKIRISSRTAQGYMQLARELPKLDPAKARRVAVLGVRGALVALAEPKSPLAQELADLPADMPDDLRSALGSPARKNRPGPRRSAQGDYVKRRQSRRDAVDKHRRALADQADISTLPLLVLAYPFIRGLSDLSKRCGSSAIALSLEHTDMCIGSLQDLSRCLAEVALQLKRLRDAGSPEPDD